MARVRILAVRKRQSVESMQELVVFFLVHVLLSAEYMALLYCSIRLLYMALGYSVTSNHWSARFEKNTL